MGCISSKKMSPDEEAEAKAQRRKLSVAPQHAGDMHSVRTLPLGKDETQDELTHGLSDVEKQGKGQTDVAILSKKGLVPYSKEKVNQDRPLVKFALDNNPKLSVFGVMDGHGEFGHLVAAYVQENLPAYLAKEPLVQNPEGSIKEAVRKMCHKLSATSNINIAFSGTTCVFGVQIDRKVYVANLGDSRCVVCRREGNSFRVIELSQDQKPENPEEKKRILAAGGRVEPLPGPPDTDRGPPRVWLAELDVPGLAMSRSIGDQVSHEVGVISVPEIMAHDIADDDVFFLWASDGVWEFLSNQQAVEIVWANKEEGYQAAAKALVNESVARWKREEDVIDDITVVIAAFNGPWKG